MATQTETSIAFSEKVVEDGAPRFVEKFLREHDQAGKTLKPMTMRAGKRINRR